MMILSSLQVTTDYPSKNENRKMPILDLSVWMAAALDEQTHVMEVSILHEFYYNKVASKAVIDAVGGAVEGKKDCTDSGGNKNSSELQQAVTLGSSKWAH